MTFMLDVPKRYPLLRGARPRHALWRRLEAYDWPEPRTLRIGAIAIVALILLAATIIVARRLSAPSGRAELATSLGQFSVGNYGGARDHARAAIRIDPKDGRAQAVLARIYLALGNGVAAEGALVAATNAGFPIARTHQLFAHAYLLQGDPDRAIAEAELTPARFGGYAARVRALALAAQGDIPAAQKLLGRILTINPANSFAWSDLGRVRLQNGDILGASQAARRAVAIDRGNLDALVLRGQLIRGQYGLTAALPWFEAALLRDPWYHAALIEQAATLGDLGRYTAMLRATRRALLVKPGSPEALYLQAVMAARAGKLDLARAMLAKTDGAIDAMPAAMLLGGVLDYVAGAYEQAIGKWGALSAQQPMNLTARRLLGAALLQSGDARGARDTLRPVALRSDADSYTLALVARAFEATGERDWAARFLDRAAASGGNEAAPFGSEGRLARLAGAAEDAPGDPAAVVGYVRGLIDAGDNAGAIAQAERIAATLPGAPPAQILLGDTLALQGRFADAIAPYARAADMRFDAPPPAALALYLGQNPNSIAARRVAANLQLAAGDWESAIATLEGLRQTIGNRDAGLLAQLAAAYAGAGAAPTAIVYGRAAHALAPMRAASADAYGWALYEAGRNRDAIQLLRKAARLAPMQTAIRWRLAQALADAGAKRAARATIRALLAEPGFADRAPATALLKILYSGEREMRTATSVRPE